MKQKIITVICAAICLALFVSSIFIFDGFGAPADAAGPDPTEYRVGESPWPERLYDDAELLVIQISESPDTFSPDDMEAVMLAKTMYAESAVLRWYGDKFGVSYRARQAAVAWVALNRVDAGGFGDDLYEVLTRPHQFAYDPDAPVTDELLDLAWDVLHRWWDEKDGATDVGRTIPPEYLYFEGDGTENYFRTEYQDIGAYWDWSLPDPYGGN